MIGYEVFSSCPALRVVLNDEPGLVDSVERLFEHGQAGMFGRYLADASPALVRAVLLAAQTIDFEQLDRHRRALSESRWDILRPADVEPMDFLTTEKQAARLQADSAAGNEALAAGQIASIAFAGGSATRFFADLCRLQNALSRPNEALLPHATSYAQPAQSQWACRFEAGDPKGIFPITPVGGLSFFEVVIAEALETGVRRGRLPLVMLMTSPATHDGTRHFLEHRDLWGFPAECLVTFSQAYLPRLDQDGLLIVADNQGRLSLTGDGHGGVYRALERVGRDGRSLLERLERQGIRHLIMHNIDNPAAQPFSPARLGYHVWEKALFTVSVVRKIDPAEKVGVLMKLRSSGRIEAVEYSVIDPVLAAQRDPASGRLRHEAANANVNVIALEAVRSDLDPILYTEKAVPARTGTVLGSSLECLNQHITRLLPPEQVRAYEVRREEFFMPTKNVAGVDSVASTVAMLSALHARRLRHCGAEVAADALCDVHPCCGDDPESLRQRGIGPGWRIEGGARVYICAHEGGKPDAPIAGEGLQVGVGATLIIASARPYGNIRLQSDRRLTCDRAGAGRVSLGKGVRIAAGVRVAVRVKSGGTIIVPDGHVFDRDVEVEVAENQECKL
jgi:UTP--glucose-1-phosphate uridylyltransferase